MEVTCYFKTSRTLLFIDLFSFQFEGAYNILTDAEESGETSTVTLYNIIMVGYFREVNSWSPFFHFVYLTYLTLIVSTIVSILVQSAYLVQCITPMRWHTLSCLLTVW